MSIPGRRRFSNPTCRTCQRGMTQGQTPFRKLQYPMNQISDQRTEEASVDRIDTCFIPETLFAPAGRTDRTDLEEEARRTLENPIVRVLLEAAQGYLLVLNEKRQILTVNPEFLEALGNEDPGWLIGLRPGESINCIYFREGPDGCGTGAHCRSCGAVLAILESQKTRNVSTGECSISIRRDGKVETRQFQVHATPLGNGSGETGSLTVFSVLDISSVRRRETFDALFLHDLLNSLESLEGQSQGRSDPEQIVRRCRALARHVKEEVLFHRSLLEAEKGTLQPRKSSVLAAKVLIELEQILQSHPRASGRTIRFRENAKGQHYLDRVILIRVLLNMALNALEASPPGAPITISYDTDQTTGRFSVHNIGAIPDHIAAHIFEQHFSTKGDASHGLGAYSTKLLGEQYLEGAVSFSTCPDAGTTFTIRLPLASDLTTSEPTSKALASAPESTISTERDPSRPLHVLFIDDIEPLAGLGKLFLERQGFEVTAQTDPSQALSLFNNHPEVFDAIVTDMTMPKLNGMELAQQIHARYPDVPIILCTGHGDLFPDVELETAGIRKVVHKPLDSRELINAVRQIAGLRTGNR